MEDACLWQNIEKICRALRPLRLPPAQDEASLHSRVGAALGGAGVAYVAEALLAPGSRIDLLAEGGVGIEIKRGRPDRTALLRQLTRYAQSPRIAALVLVCEGLPPLPARVAGKPCLGISLRGQWGVSV